MAAYMEDLRGFLLDELHPVSYSFLSSTLSVSTDAAKRMLFEFAEAHPKDVYSTYLLSGWAKGEEGQGMKRVVKVVCEEKLEIEEKALDRVVSKHLFSLVPREANETPRRPKMLAESLWMQDHQARETQYEADPSVLNSMRDNRHASITFSKVVRDLKPKRNAAGAATTGPPRSSAKAPAPDKESPKSSKPAAPAGPKLSAAEQRMQELKDQKTGKPAAAAPKLSAAELRMKELAEGSGRPAVQKSAKSFFGASATSNKKAATKAKPTTAKKEEEPTEIESDDDEDKRFKKESKPVLDFQFDSEKGTKSSSKIAPKKAPAKKKPAGKGKGKKEKDDFINDESSESESSDGSSADDEAESGKDDQEEEAKPLPVRQKKRMLEDSDDEEADKKKQGDREAPSKDKGKRRIAAQSSEEDSSSSSGSDSDSSHASQHTNASDPDVAAVDEKEVKAGEAKKKEVVDSDGEDADAPHGRLVITKKDGSKQVAESKKRKSKGSDSGSGSDEDTKGKKKRKSKKKSDEGEGEGEGEGGKKKRKSRKKKDSDDESPSKPRKSRKKVVELDAGQKMLDLSKFSAENAPAAAPAKRRRKVDKTWMDAKGYMVTEEVWEDISDGEAVGEAAPAAEAQASGSAEKVAGKPKAAPKAAESKPAPKAKPAEVKKAKKDVPRQGNIMSFFSKK